MPPSESLQGCPARQDALPLSTQFSQPKTRQVRIVHLQRILRVGIRVIPDASLAARSDDYAVLLVALAWVRPAVGQRHHRGRCAS
jgi:hypothetical protein